MKKSDQGLISIGIVIFAAILACLLVITLPVIKSDGPTRVSDWLGFAGGVVGGLMTLVAAVVAWFAVQKQIATQTEIADTQISIQRFDILADLDERLVDDQYLIGQLRLSNEFIMNVRDGWLNSNPITKEVAAAARDSLQKEREGLNIALRAYERAAANKAAFTAGSGKRHQLTIAALAVNATAQKLIGKLTIAELKAASHSPINKEDFKACTEIDFVAPHSNFIARADEYDELVHAERMRVVALKAKIRREQSF